MTNWGAIDIKIFMSAFDRTSDEKVIINNQNSETMNTLKQLHDIDIILKDLDL